MTEDNDRSLELDQLTGYFSSDELMAVARSCGLHAFPAVAAAVDAPSDSPGVRAAIGRGLMARGIFSDPLGSDQKLYGAGALLLGPVVNAVAHVSLRVFTHDGGAQIIWHVIGPFAVRQEVSSVAADVYGFTALASENLLRDVADRSGLGEVLSGVPGLCAEADVERVRASLEASSCAGQDRGQGLKGGVSRSVRDEASMEAEVMAPADRMTVSGREIRLLGEIALDGDLGDTAITWLRDESGGTWGCSGTSSIRTARLTSPHSILQEAVAALPSAVPGDSVEEA